MDFYMGTIPVAGTILANLWVTIIFPRFMSLCCDFCCNMLRKGKDALQKLLNVPPSLPSCAALLLVRADLG